MKTNKAVSMLSSRHTCALIDTGKNDFASKENVLKPDAISYCNQNIWSVYLFLTRVNVLYSNERKGGNKCYRKIDKPLIELALYNAYIVSKNQLIEEIITFHLNGQPELSACRGQSLEKTWPLWLKGRNFTRRKQEINVVDVCDVIN